MLDLTRKPFHFLPLKSEACFDLTCEFTLSLIESIDIHYSELIAIAKKITEELPKANFYLYKRSFFLIDTIIDSHAKLFNCINLSLGIPSKCVKTPITIFDGTNYAPNLILRKEITGMRNSAQHFEERIQIYKSQIDPFLELYYEDENMRWGIKFGKSGHSHSGQKNNNSEFKKEKLFFKSYRIEVGNLISISVNVNHIWLDTIEMLKLIEENMNQIISQNGYCCPPPRNVSAFIHLNGENSIEN